MKDGRFSTIRFNEWICISAQYEKAIARIGKQVYQGYSKGLVTDFTSIELCRDIAETFREAKELREEMEEELERDALDGLNEEESKKADEVRELTQAQRTKRAVKLKVTKFMGRQSINRALANHRNKVKDLSRDLGQRAIICFPEEPVLKVRGHKSLCRLANKLQEDADAKWQEITASKEKGGGLSFHTILFGFIGDFARFSKGTHLGKMILKYFKYDEDEENKKLTQQYAGTKTAEALKAQMAEIDEPMLDVGREIDNMQQEYEGTMDDWSTVPEDGFDDGQVTEVSYDFSPDAEVEWSPDADAWNPDEGVDNEFLDAVADVPDVAAKTSTPAPPTPASPKLLRKRHEPEAESWMSEPAPEPEAWLSEPDPEPEDWMSEAPVAQAPAPAAPPPPAFTPKINSESATEKPAAAAESDDWGWGTEDDSSGFDSFAPSLGQSSEPVNKPAAPAPPRPAAPPEPETTTEFLSKPSGKKPPFVKSKAVEKPLGDWSQEEPEDDTHKVTPPRPAAQADGWGSAPASDGWDSAPGDGWSTPAASTTPSTPAPKAEDDYGWGAPAAAESSPKPKPPEPTPPTPKSEPIHEIDPTLDTMTIDVKKLAERIRAESTDPDDPLLKLLDTQESSGLEKPGDSGDLGDNLLPDFLRDRTDEEPSVDDTFIPELPSFLESEDAPNLEIVPFGSTPDKDDENEDPFIPQMPE